MSHEKKRYWLFAFDGYEPKGGFDDFVCANDSVEELIATIKIDKIRNELLFGVDRKTDYGQKIIWYEYVQIVDIDKSEIVKSGYCGVWI